MRDDLFPERLAGGYSRLDGTVEFYGRVRSLLSPGLNVLDFGAGRGGQLDANVESPYKTNMLRLQTAGVKVVGIDLDPAVLGNPWLDESVVLGTEQKLPFADDSFDLVMADWVLEHVDDPILFESELRRVLKPGSWFCARTPSRYGLTGIGATVVPNKWHDWVLKYVQPDRESIDIFPVRYRMNTRRQLKKVFPADRWRNASYPYNGDPAYTANSKALARCVMAYSRLTPSSFDANIFVFLQKTAPIK